jgi:hypothetical protein
MDQQRVCLTGWPLRYPVSNVPGRALSQPAELPLGTGKTCRGLMKEAGSEVERALAFETQACDRRATGELVSFVTPPQPELARCWFFLELGRI